MRAIKKILYGVLFCCISPPAFATPSCGSSLMPAFTANQATQLCAKMIYNPSTTGNTQITSPAGKTIQFLPTGITATRLTLSSNGTDQTLITFGDGVPARPHLDIHASTTDGADTGYIIIGPGGNNSLETGSAIVMYGNEDIGGLGGYLKLDSGNVTGAKVEIITPDNILHTSADYKVRWYWQTGYADMFNDATNGGNIVFQKDGTGIRQSADFPAAAGSDQSGAAQLIAWLAFVTGADGAKGVKLPVNPEEGSTFYVYNTANAALVVYPGSGDAIGALSEDTSVSVAAYGMLLCQAKDSSQWWCTEGANP